MEPSSEVKVILFYFVSCLDFKKFLMAMFCSTIDFFKEEVTTYPGYWPFLLSQVFDRQKYWKSNEAHFVCVVYKGKV